MNRGGGRSTTETMATHDVGAQIHVQVRLFTNLRRFLPKGYDGPLSYALPPGATVADLLATIGVPPEQEVTAGIREELAHRDTVLQDGDEVLLFTPMEGGSGSAGSTTTTTTTIGDPPEVAQEDCIG